MITAITFTYPDDAWRATKYSKLLPKDWRKRWVIETAHYDALLPYAKHVGAELKCIDFDRGESLRGVDAVHGVIRSLTDPDVWKDSECVVKLDSDCELWDADSIVNPVIKNGYALCGVSRVPATTLIVSGACYAISKKCADTLLTLSDETIKKTTEDAYGHEDHAMSYLISNTGLPVLIYPFSRMNCRKRERENDGQIFWHKFKHVL